MKRFIRLWLLATALCAAGTASAAITCTSLTSSGFSTAFSGTTPPSNITQSSFTVTCNRNLAGDPTTLTYTVGANNGLNPAGGGINQASLGANRLRYEVYKDSACGTRWRAAGGGLITATMTLSGFVPTSQTTSWWGCVTVSQTLPAGTYTDTVTMTLNCGGGCSLTNTFPVNIATPTTCSITTAPSTLSFSYTALGSAQSASSSFQPTCTIYLPYTMSLSANVAVAAGLNYTLVLNTASSGGTNTLAATGTGAAQTFYINGNIAAGQAGTCPTGTCTATNTHTLTITY